VIKVKKLYRILCDGRIFYGPEPSDYRFCGAVLGDDWWAQGDLHKVCKREGWQYDRALDRYYAPADIPNGEWYCPLHRAGDAA
jgi:hypothetical protein